MAHKVITKNDLGDGLEVAQNKLGVKVKEHTSSYLNMIEKTTDGLTVNHEAIRRFIREDRDVIRALSGEDITITWMRDFAIFDRFNPDHRRLTSPARTNDDPIELRPNQDLHITYSTRSEAGDQAVGVFNVWYTLKNAQVSETNPLMVLNCLKCRINGPQVNGYNPLIVVDPETNKYAIVSYREKGDGVNLKRLNDTTGLRIFIHYVTLSGSWGNNFRS